MIMASLDSKQLDPEEVDGPDTIAQLQREADMKRMKTSEAIANLLKYVQEHQEMDPLVRGFNDPNQRNPYKRERINKCLIT